VILPMPSKNRVELDAELRSAKSELKAAEKELKRVQALYKDKIVARRRLEQSERDVGVQRARLDAARAIGLLDPSQTPVQSGASQALRFSLRAPISGTVVATNVSPGALVEAGQNLLSIVDLERVWIEGTALRAGHSQVAPRAGMVRGSGAAGALRADPTQSAVPEYRQRDRCRHAIGPAYSGSSER
jgi:multidrug efflux pump subunit AcrA (membrane-fusion protein)